MVYYNIKEEQNLEWNVQQAHDCYGQVSTNLWPNSLHKCEDAKPSNKHQTTSTSLYNSTRSSTSFIILQDEPEVQRRKVSSLGSGKNTVFIIGSYIK